MIASGIYAALNGRAATVKNGVPAVCGKVCVTADAGWRQRERQGVIPSQQDGSRSGATIAGQADEASVGTRPILIAISRGCDHQHLASFLVDGATGITITIHFH
jgi:hypothetical protein